MTQHNPTPDPIALAIEPLPDSVRPAAARLMSEAVMLEREFQNLIDAALRLRDPAAHADPVEFVAQLATQQRVIDKLHTQWLAGLDRLAVEARAAGVTTVAARRMLKSFDDMIEKVTKLNGRLLTITLAGPVQQCSARSGSNDSRS